MDDRVRCGGQSECWSMMHLTFLASSASCAIHSPRWSSKSSRNTANRFFVSSQTLSSKHTSAVSHLLIWLSLTTSPPSASATANNASRCASRNLTTSTATSFPNFFFNDPYSRYALSLIWPPLRPVAPEHASRASNMAIRSPPSLPSSSVFATAVPVIPEPITTTSTSPGSEGDWWVATCGWGHESQKDSVGVELGRPGSEWIRLTAGASEDLRDWQKAIKILIVERMPPMVKTSFTCMICGMWDDRPAVCGS